MQEPFIPCVIEKRKKIDIEVENLMERIRVPEEKKKGVQRSKEKEYMSDDDEEYDTIEEVEEEE